MATGTLEFSNHSWRGANDLVDGSDPSDELPDVQIDREVERRKMAQKVRLIITHVFHDGTGEARSLSSPDRYAFNRSTRLAGLLSLAEGQHIKATVTSAHFVTDAELDD